MMKFGDLKERIASAMVVRPDTVHITMRNLRENELLTTGARGVNAPDMTYLDAARILIAQIVDSNPGRAAPRIARDFGGLPCSNPDFALAGYPFTLSELVPDSPTDTFEEAVAAVIRVFAECRETEAFRDAGTRLRDGSFDDPRCDIEIHEEDSAAYIWFGAAQYSFEADLVPISEWTEEKDARYRLGRQVIAHVNKAVVGHIARGFMAHETEHSQSERVAG